MSLFSLMRHRVNSFRIKPNGIGIQRTYQPVLTNQRVMIQPVTAEYAAKINEVFGRTYNMFTQIDADFQVGDKVVDQDGKEYRITGSLKRNYGSNPHITFIISEQVQAGPDQ